MVRHGADARVPSLGASGAIAAVLGAYFVLYPGSRVTTWIFPIFVVRVPAWIWLGLWFLYQLIEGSFGLFNAKANGGGVAFFAHVGGFVFGCWSHDSSFGREKPRPRRDTPTARCPAGGDQIESPADRPDGGRPGRDEAGGFGAGTPSSRRQASVSWSTDVSSTRSGCRSRNRSSPGRPPATALSAICASVTVTPGGLPSPDVAQGAWRQPAGRVQGLQADTGQEPGVIGCVAAQPPGDPQRDGEHLRRVADVRTGLVDHLPRCSSSSQTRCRRLPLAVEVVLEGPRGRCQPLQDNLSDAGALRRGPRRSAAPARASIRAFRLALRRSSRLAPGTPPADATSTIVLLRSPWTTARRRRTTCPR